MLLFKTDHVSEDKVAKLIVAFLPEVTRGHRTYIPLCIHRLEEYSFKWYFLYMNLQPLQPRIEYGVSYSSGPDVPRLEPFYPLAYET